MKHIEFVHLQDKISTTIVKLLQTAEKVILLTGTPVNNPADISPLLNSIIGSDVLPTSEKLFKEKFYMAKPKDLPRH